jgi:ATP-binding cassette subfamily C (CFTR/MRP) protein 1
MLGDLYKVKGDVVLRGRVAYVAQSPWIMNASVKDNILFGHRWDPTFYEQTIVACALRDDLIQLPDGDQTLVGERGISLSGRQKARVSLARAVYARADIYILDDVLSAVDQHVGRHIINHVLGSHGLLSGKTRILATNSIPILMESDFVLLIRHGAIIERGTYAQLMAMKGEVAALIKSTSQDDSPTNSPMSASTISQDTVLVDNSDEEDSEEEEGGEAPAAAGDGVSQLEPIRSVASSHPRRTSATTLRRASTASARGPRGKVVDEEQAGFKSGQANERSEQGKVKWSVYAAYASSANGVAVAVWFVFLVAAQTAQIGKLHANFTPRRNLPDFIARYRDLR